jgi:hypothetical protein
MRRNQHSISTGFPARPSVRHSTHLYGRRRLAAARLGAPIETGRVRTVLRFEATIECRTSVPTVPHTYSAYLCSDCRSERRPHLPRGARCSWRETADVRTNVEGSFGPGWGVWQGASRALLGERVRIMLCAWLASCSVGWVCTAGATGSMTAGSTTASATVAESTVSHRDAVARHRSRKDVLDRSPLRLIAADGGDAEGRPIGRSADRCRATRTIAAGRRRPGAAAPRGPRLVCLGRSRA